MNVLVTGGSGRIGQYLVRRLLEAGHDVVEAQRRGPSNDGAGFLYLDLNCSIDASTLESFDAIIHLAAASDRRERNVDFETVNHEATRRLLDAASQARVARLIVASSILVHGDRSDKPIHANSPIAPVDDYARSKAAAERDLVSSAAHETTVDIVRLAGVLDCGGVLPTVRRIAERLPIVPVPRHDNRRAVLSPEGLTSNFLELLTRKLPSGSAVAITVMSDGEMGFRKQLELAAKQANLRRVFVPLPNQLWGLADRLTRGLGYSGLAGAFADLKTSTLPTVARGDG